MNTNLPAGLHDNQFELYTKCVDIYATHGGRVLTYYQLPPSLLALIDQVIELRPKVKLALDLLGLTCNDARRRAFIHCNMANFDFKPDVSACLTKIETEYVSCSRRDTCLFQGYLCSGITCDENKFSLRDLKTMALIRKGFLDKEIAELLFCSPETVKTNKRKIQKKLNIERKAMIAVVATEWQLE